MRRKKKNSIESIGFRDTFRALGALRLTWGWIFIAFVLSIAYNRFLIAMPSVTAELSASSLSSRDIIRAVLVYIGAFALQRATYLSQSYTTLLSKTRARASVWNRMLGIRMDHYGDSDPSGLTSTITNDLDTAIERMVVVAVRIIPDIYYIFTALKTIGDYNFVLMISVFLILPIKILNTIFLGRWNYRTQAGVYRKIGSLTGYLSERIKHLSLIKTNANEARELASGEKVIDELYRANMDVVKYGVVSGAVSTVIGVLQNVVTVVFGVICLQRGIIDIKQWIAFFMYAGTLSGKFDSMINYWINFKTIQGGLARIARLVEAPQEQSDNPALLQEMPESRDIVFDHVSFSYGDKTALKDVSFTVKENSFTAIVGLCGSGKTTAIHLIERFYDADEGEVRIGGVDVEKISSRALRKGISLVHQGAGIFGGSLRQVFTYGLDRDVTDEEILAVAERTGALDYIRDLPQGLDTVVAAEGTSMSGGQRQRLVLTREMLRNTQILLLDEPTAALDAVACQKVKTAIQEAAKDKTVIMVTHDLYLLDIADQVIVLENGCLQKQGTPEELSGIIERYAEVCPCED